MATTSPGVSSQPRLAGAAPPPPVESHKVGPGPAIIPPRWVPIASTIVCVLAVLDSSYLTYAHFTSATILACSTKGFVNCALVTTSVYSHFLGLPVSVLGLAWSAGMLVLCSPWAWRAVSPWVGRIRLLGAVTGAAMVIWLMYAELVKLRHLCEYCTLVHILTIVLFVVVVFGTALAVHPEDEIGTD
jgi:uncharacterized membrane protein